MIQLNEYFQSIAEVDKLGFSNKTNIKIPLDYLKNKQFILFRTCHSYGDWVILSAMPRLLKEKYPDCTVIIPSPYCISRYFSPDRWFNKHKNPFNNVLEIFTNNPYVDGMIDEIPLGIPVYHDHFRIYNELNLDIPLIQQMLKFWRFEDYEIEDCQPELYWNENEIQEGNNIIEQIFKNEQFGFLYIDSNSLPSSCNSLEHIKEKEILIQQEIDKHNLPWLYYSGDSNFNFNIKTDMINTKDLSISLRVQNYIKSKAQLIIGHQGGFGTDCMSRYTQCYIIPLHPGELREHIQKRTIYLT